MTLSTDEFCRFWREVHAPESGGSTGPKPFAWQQRLVEQIAADGGWPDVIDVPTGLGKTAVLDIATFTMALSRNTPPKPPLPRRIFMVVDRRIVVDQSFDHAQKIGERLRDAAPGSVAEKVAAALRPEPLDRHDQAEYDPAIPLVVGRMRGGVTWAWRWLERPDQPAIIVGTIDQIGSRVLFDGYGVGETLRPIDAALTGTDSLILVDEAHLADVFLATLRDVHRMGSALEPLGLVAPSIVVMSATAPRVRRSDGRPPVVFRIDREQELADPAAAARLLSPKTLVAAEVKVGSKRRDEQVGGALANVAREMGKTHDVVGVVANTVAVARAAFDALRSADPATPGCPDDAVLITGRQRSIDRDRLWASWRDRVAAGRDRQDGPLYVVATQTIEVGADLDFSALVTESASIDALIQRLGRLNRRGDWERATVVVVHPSTATLDDPIYGMGRQHTWDWLAKQVAPQEIGQRSVGISTGDGIDGSPVGLDRLLEDLDPESVRLMRMPSPRAPVLFPSTVERWVRTSPRGIDTPPIGPYLHGLERDVPSVTILWRQARRDDEDGVTAQMVRAELKASIDLLPPSPVETIDVPLWAARAWLRGDNATAAEVADLLVAATQRDPGDEPNNDLPLVMVKADGTTGPLRVPLVPGMTIVAPTWRGGLDEYGWNPSSDDPVTDVADLGEHRLSRTTGGRGARRLALRIDPVTLRQFMPDEEVAAWLDGEIDKLREALATGDDDPVDLSKELLGKFSERLANADGDGMAGELRQLVGALLDAGRDLRAVEPPPLEGVQQPLLLVHGPGAVERWSSESTGVGTSLSDGPVTLERHQAAVAKRAESFADALRLPVRVREALSIAAAHHDLGKLDPRFQQMLNNGVAPPPGQRLAKSGMDPARRWVFAYSRQLAGYPSGMRHEAFSARAVCALHAEHPEHDLIVHLVAAHHGRGRPLEQCVADPDPVIYEVTTAGGTVTLSTADGPDWDQPRRFRMLNERFGPWGLAMLEAIVRLSDIGCSAEGT